MIQHKGHKGHKGKTLKSRFIFRPVDDSMDSVSHVRDVEVQEEPKLVATEFEIRQELRAMDR